MTIVFIADWDGDADWQAPEYNISELVVEGAVKLQTILFPQMDETSRLWPVAAFFSRCMNNSLYSFFEAAGDGNEEIVIHYLKTKIPVNITDANGNTPLHWAARKGHEKIVKILLKAGADAQTMNAQGQSARDLAVANAHQAIADLVDVYLSWPSLTRKTVLEIFKRRIDYQAEPNLPRTVKTIISRIEEALAD